MSPMVTSGSNKLTSKKQHISANGFLMTSSTDWSTCSSDAMKLAVNKIRYRIHVKGGLYRLVTLPDTNGSHKSGSHPKRTLVFHPPLFLAGAILVSQRVQASLFQSCLYITKFARRMPCYKTSIYHLKLLTDLILMHRSKRTYKNLLKKSQQICTCSESPTNHFALSSPCHHLILPYLSYVAQLHLHAQPHRGLNLPSPHAHPPHQDLAESHGTIHVDDLWRWGRSKQFSN